ncbi:hypothetical protein [Vagococcus xieshaowenii]|uniref:HNH endonuclease n=1 Tax=Vagococcus xieshaowenii TaxID=2562451 RepID=A0AAJ5EEV6_9ENTE|nr:hypothetical protein [Vagococcus xieshaowenii]QCA28733.1 hypothetical protein E4Z98_05165 [Vagococcus xieshaowenii]TFZ40459.1 hypothetical protein E4031_06610 [Vagococcus xieshaowenii]
MIPLEMKPKIKELHNAFFKEEFIKEFIYMFLKDSRDFNFDDEISKDFKELLIKAKKEYEDKKKEDEKKKKKKISISKNLVSKEKMLTIKEFKCLFMYANSLLIEEEYSELIKKEKQFGNYLIKLDKKVFNSKVRTRCYDIYKKNGKKDIELINNFEELFKENFYKNRMCRNIGVIKFKNIENMNEVQREGIESKDWCAYLYTFLLGISVCPYCNSQYIYTYQNKNKGKIRAELDHCFPKVHHPFLAVSLFNLVPSCSQCNSSLKGSTDIGIDSVMNVFTESFLDKYKFYIHSEKSIESFIGNSLDYDIKIVYDKNYPHSVRLKKFIESFHIENRYNFFKKYLNEQIYYQVNHSKSYNNFLQELLKDIPDKESIHIHRRKYIEERNENRLLGKLVSDILDDKELTINNFETNNNFETKNYKETFLDEKTLKQDMNT